MKMKFDMVIKFNDEERSQVCVRDPDLSLAVHLEECRGWDVSMPGRVQRQCCHRKESEEAMNHYYEYDRGEQHTDGPWGKPARIKMLNLWLCADHADYTERFLYVFDPNVSAEERKRRQQEELGWWQEKS
jgi:hypothetical protein